MKRLIVFLSVLLITFSYSTIAFAGEKEDALYFMKNNFESLSQYENIEDDYDILITDVTGDGQDEIIMSSYQIGMPMVVLEKTVYDYTILYESPYTEKQGYRVEDIKKDRFNNLYIAYNSHGTGIGYTFNSIIRWNNNSFHEIWTGMTSNFYDPYLEDEEWYERIGEFTISGNGQPETLNYNLTCEFGYKKDLETCITTQKTITNEVYTFDQSKYKFTR